MYTSNDFKIQKNSTIEEILFIRRFKLVGLGDVSKIPEKLADGDLVQVEIRTLALELGISRQKLRIIGDFELKKRKNTISDDPEVILLVRNFFEQPENSSQGDRVRNIVKIDEIEVHRRYLKKPIDIIAKNFIESTPIKFVSISTVKKIVRKHLKHLTIPTKRLVCKFIVGTKKN